MKEICGEVVSLNISLKKGVVKTPVERIRLIENFGLEGDAHGGEWHRQVSLLAIESIDTMRGKGIDLTNGIFAENITTKGIELKGLKIGTQFLLGESIIEVTQIGKHCHNDNCGVKKVVGDCVMPREGIFAKVLKSGEVRVGDKIKLIEG